MADPLANLVATLALGAEENITIPLYGQWVITPLVDEGVEEVKTLFVYEIDEEDWRQPLIDYLEHGRLQVSQGTKQNPTESISFSVL